MKKNRGEEKKYKEKKKKKRKGMDCYSLYGLIRVCMDISLFHF